MQNYKKEMNKPLFLKKGLKTISGGNIVRYYYSSKNDKRILCLSIIIVCILLFLLVFFVLIPKYTQIKFADQMEEMAQKNEQPIFKLDQIVLYSSANAIDYSESQNLQDLSISQYTDITMYINNKLSSEELTQENTISELYIDNIEVNVNSNLGKPIFGYKSPYHIGKFRTIEQESIPERIDFQILRTNEENAEHDYSTPVFYTDCSNPITLGYINQDIITHFRVSENQNNMVSFDGKILKNIGIDLDSFACEIKGNIHIKNNLGEKFSCNITLNIPLKAEDGGIYQGYIIQIIQDIDQLYYFWKEG